MKAILNNEVLANSDETILIEGNHYFPIESVKTEYLKASDTKTICPWKGLASYYNVVINNEIYIDGAWCYPEPKEGAKQIQDYVAFGKNVIIK